MIFEHHIVVTVLVVVSIVVQLSRRLALYFYSIESQEVDFLKVEQLSFLKICYSVLV